MAAIGPRASRTDPSGVDVPGIVKVAEYVGDLRALGQCCRAAGRLCQREGSRRVWGWLSDSDFEAAEEWARAEERQTYYSGSASGAPIQPHSGSEAATSSSGSSSGPQVTPAPVPGVRIVAGWAPLIMFWIEVVRWNGCAGYAG